MSVILSVLQTLQNSAKHRQWLYLYDPIFKQNTPILTCVVVVTVSGNLNSKNIIRFNEEKSLWRSSVNFPQMQVCIQGQLFTDGDYVIMYFWATNLTLSLSTMHGGSGPQSQHITTASSDVTVIHLLNTCRFLWRHTHKSSGQSWQILIWPIWHFKKYKSLWRCFLSKKNYWCHSDVIISNTKAAL